MDKKCPKCRDGRMRFMAGTYKLSGGYWVCNYCGHREQE